MMSYTSVRYVAPQTNESRATNRAEDVKPKFVVSSPVTFFRRRSISKIGGKKDKESKEGKEEKKCMKRKSEHKRKFSCISTPLEFLPELMESDQDNIPIFVQKCIKFIEQRGLDAEGIYRVPGNHAHVELFFQKFQEDSNVDIASLDISVNSVATALKDFFSNRFPPLFKKEVMLELEAKAAGSVPELKKTYISRLVSLKTLLNKLPVANFDILKYIFQHLFRVAANSKLNSMDSKNLAICWWPALMPIEFTTLGRFEQLRPYFEDIVKTMIDKFIFLYCG